MQNNTNAGLRPDQKGYETRLVVMMFFVWGIVFLDRMSVLFLAPYIVPDLHLTNRDVGLLASALAVAWAFSSLVFGAVSDHVGRRRIFLPVVFAFAALSWLSGIAKSFTQLLGSRGLMGVDEGAAFTTLTVTLEEASVPERRGRNVGMVVSAAALISGGLGPILVTQIAEHFGWRTAFFLSGAPMLILGLLLWKYLKEPPASISQPPLRQYFTILKYRNVVLSCIAACGFMTWLWVMGAFAPLYITEVTNNTATMAGFIIGAGGIGGFVWAFLAPGWSDRLGRKPVLIGLAILSALVPLTFQIGYLQQHPWLMALAGFIANGGQAIVALVIVLIPAESVPRKLSGTAIGLATFVGEIVGGTIAPAIGGAAADKYGLAAPLWIAAGGGLLVFLVALAIKETSPAKTNAHSLPGARESAATIY
jgi:predicted MFS family arabinose efflux permease